MATLEEPTFNFRWYNATGTDLQVIANGVSIALIEPGTTSESVAITLMGSALVMELNDEDTVVLRYIGLGDQYEVCQEFPNSDGCEKLEGNFLKSDEHYFIRIIEQDGILLVGTLDSFPAPLPENQG
jgi:hypothetical protein